VKFGKNMSRIGKKPIQIPESVEVKIEGDLIMVKGPKGESKNQIRPEIKMEAKDKQIEFNPQVFHKGIPALWGTYRSLIFNMIEGVTKGFEKALEIEGVGYRASLEGRDLVLNLGYSQPIKIKAPQGIEFKVEKNIITVSGIDKQLVGQVAAEIRSARKPEPYKGKGIRYRGEIIRRKAGKKAVATE
jgi:large subunit ribosomal protein L6